MTIPRSRTPLQAPPSGRRRGNDRWAAPRLGFGRHRGRPIDEVPEDYLRWLLAESDRLSPATRAAIEEALGIDQPETGDDDAPPPDSAGVKLPGIIWAGQQQMRARYAGDPGALAVVGDGFALLRRLCEQQTGQAWPDDCGGPA